MQNELEERNKKRKARKLKRRLMSLLAFILLLIYIPALWNWVFSVNYEIGVIKTATLELKVPLKGILIRKESLLKSPGDGVLIPKIQNGEKVAKGNEVASYIQSNMRDVVDNYRQTELDILKRVVAGFDGAIGQEREVWENAIEKQIEKLTSLSDIGDLSNAHSVRLAVDNVLEAKARYMLDNDQSLSNMKNERNELDRLRSSIAKTVKSIASSASGVVSYKCDGMEDVITPQNMDQITQEKIIAALETQKKTDKSLIPAEINVDKDQPFCKIIGNDEAWITFIVPEKEGKEIAVLFEKAKLKSGTLSYELELEGCSERIPIVVEKIGDLEKGFQSINAKMSKFIEKTIDLRGVKGSLVIKSVTGMRVPLRSLFNENSVDNTADIAVVEMNKAVFKRIQIIGKQDSYAVIESLNTSDIENNVNVFDIFLVNPKNIVEGQVIEK